MKTNSFKKSCSTILLASSFLVLTACGGGGSSTPAPEPEVGSAEWIAEQQAALDSLGTTLDPTSAEGIAELQNLLDAYNAVEAGDTATTTASYVSYSDACASGGVIDTAAEIACVQDIMDS